MTDGKMTKFFIFKNLKLRLATKKNIWDRSEKLSIKFNSLRDLEHSHTQNFAFEFNVKF